jgi:hypothetical protein
VRATPPARALAWTLDFLDRAWGPLVVVAVVVLEAAVFAPREQFIAMIIGGCVGAAAMVVWLVDRFGM